jgi:hypothetical protein
MEMMPRTAKTRCEPGRLAVRLHDSGFGGLLDGFELTGLAFLNKPR